MIRPILEQRNMNNITLEVSFNKEIFQNQIKSIAKAKLKLILAINQSHEHRPDDDYDFVYDERRTSNHRIKQ
ncbi:hypothetical protein DERP_008183 [Dermatophagoides pteronyssinus]|uniref:Uncharacterized protein n=1 Tax=Dermatophagoides pteronyssinus TaxID=6956 RepID=A0ABQ8JJY5_DERPT|nr:hypothetical protein DERP_008183 [Dermatophagoides pteronyssinus]